MTLEKLIKIYYETENITEIIETLYIEGILPGTFKSFIDFKKTLKWNLEKEVYYYLVMIDDNILYFTVSTGKLFLYLTYSGQKDFEENFIKQGLKKHRSYKKEKIYNIYGKETEFLFYDKKYE